MLNSFFVPAGVEFFRVFQKPLRLHKLNIFFRDISWEMQTIRSQTVRSSGCKGGAEQPQIWCSLWSLTVWKRWHYSTMAVCSIILQRTQINYKFVLLSNNKWLHFYLQVENWTNDEVWTLVLQVIRVYCVVSLSVTAAGLHVNITNTYLIM